MSPVNPGCGLQHQRDSVSVAEPVAVPETAGSAALAPDGEGGKTSGMESGELVSRLRRAGCVFAEEEARLLRGAARDAAELERLCTRREAGEFLEHVVGSVELMGERLAVRPGVFVPRQRTALLIEQTLAALRGRERPVVLEACCGVAPVAALVARRVPGADLHAADTDRRALESARRNLPPSAALHRGDGLDALPGALMGRIDVIAAVPPYVPDHAEELMPREARDHEPQAALLGGRDGLEQVRRLTDAAPRWLAPGGQLLIEMHRAQARVMTDVLHATAQYARAEIVEWEEGGTAVLRLRRDGPPGP